MHELFWVETDIEWQVVYVGSAEDQSKDQELDAVLLPADTTGRFKFVLQVPAPDHSQIAPADILGVTIVLLTCSYKDAEFIRVGYYVNNEHPDFPTAPEPPGEGQGVDQIEDQGDDAGDDQGDEDDEMDVEDESQKVQPTTSSTPKTPSVPTVMPDITKITRTIAAAGPRITKFPHKFDFDQPATMGTFADPELSGDVSQQTEAPGRPSTAGMV